MSSDNFVQVSDLTMVGEKRPTYLAIGVFDGVHRGHQALLRHMVEAAREARAWPAVLTFFPHPVTIIRGDQGRIYLGTLEERVEFLSALGLKLVAIHPFNEQVRMTRAADFVNQLCRNLDLRQLWGGSFGLGHNREGDRPFLEAYGREKGFTVHKFDALVHWEGERVSSSRVRRALAAGDLAEVKGCLGRPYQVRGKVVPGDGRGKTIGVPTANLNFWDELALPANGVYATIAHVGENQYAAATNVGVRPTVNGHHLNVEAHLLDFSGDLYGQEITLAFQTRIRDERKFSGLDALVTQIRADIEQVRRELTELAFLA